MVERNIRKREREHLTSPQKRFGTRIKTTSEAIAGTVGVFFGSAGVVYCFDSSEPGGSIVNRASDVVTFLPQSYAKEAVSVAMVFGGAFVAVHFFQKLIQNGEFVAKLLSLTADFRAEGLMIRTETSINRKFNLPVDTVAGCIDFMPDGLYSKDPDNASLNLLRPHYKLSFTRGCKK